MTLHQHSGLAFDGQNAAAIIDVDNGLLEWDRVTMEWVETTSKDNRRVEHTQLMMVAYLIELAYELCIGEYDNVSESGGFEALCGTFAN